VSDASRRTGPSKKEVGITSFSGGQIEKKVGVGKESDVRKPYAKRS